ncbi:hypothetical protein BU23DRAFT_209311 [Bimuria novae-zelandiae CBS 107.79]|uniref:Uncharacterized protein n=1 Tax=Bimuria novae-zelandiae CBS 107.79 TaxID=1447943 RepID=A0A6A5V2P8_9PLEO|nr:hypothetical protein BU23DRAFT_209311 [Bimuria novae-zelandiae CBS 107.79]
MFSITEKHNEQRGHTFLKYPQQHLAGPHIYPETPQPQPQPFHQRAKSVQSPPTSPATILESWREVK